MQCARGGWRWDYSNSAGEPKRNRRISITWVKQTNIKNPSCKVNKAVYLQVVEWFTNKQRQRTAGSSISISRIAESDVLGDYSFEAGIRPLSTGQLCLYFRCIRTFFSRKQRQEAHSGLFRWGGGETRQGCPVPTAIVYLLVFRVSRYWPLPLSAIRSRLCSHGKKGLFLVLCYYIN